MAVAEDLDRATDSSWDWVAKQTRAYLASGGEQGHESNGVYTLILVTTGRKSGEPRCTCLIYDTHGEDFVVVASKGGDPDDPDWLKPDDGFRVELSCFDSPDHEPGSPAALANELGLRNVCFEVDDIDATLDWLVGEGYGLIGGVGQFEDQWRMAYVRGPAGITVALAQRLG